MRAGPATLLALVAAALATAPGADAASAPAAAQPAAALSALDAARALDGVKPAMTADSAAGVFSRALERAERDGTRQRRKNGGRRRKDGKQGKNRKDRKDRKNRNERKGRKGNRKGKNGGGRGSGGGGGKGGLPNNGRPELGGDNSVVCGPKATFAASEEYCAALGLWVCSVADLTGTASTCGGTIWANQECGSAGGHLAFSGASGTRCHASDVKQYVQCCSI